MYLKNFNLKNKTALVTGAGKGIGKACAIALAQAGADLIIISRTKKDLLGVQKKIISYKRKCIFFECDLFNTEELNNVFKNKEVFIEELIKNDDGEHTIPDAYKVYSFNGEIEFILHRSFKNNKYYSNCYDKDWSPIDIKVDDFPKGELQPRPRKYLQMLEYSKIMVGKVFSNVFVTLVFYFNNTDPVFDKVVTNPNKGQNVNNKRTQEFLNYLCKKNDLSL